VTAQQWVNPALDQSFQIEIFQSCLGTEYVATHTHTMMGSATGLDHNRGSTVHHCTTAPLHGGCWRVGVRDRLGKLAEWRPTKVTGPMSLNLHLHVRDPSNHCTIGILYNSYWRVATR
jgi:hypothetical protein